jgi:hypothetical protein
MGKKDKDGHCNALALFKLAEEQAAWARSHCVTRKHHVPYKQLQCPLRSGECFRWSFALEDPV